MYIAYKERNVSDFAQFKFRIPNCLSEVCNKLHFAVQGRMGLTGGPEDVLGPVNLSNGPGSLLCHLLST